MTPHEQNLILKVADEVRAADRTAVDRDAERLIRAEVASQPNAAYILTQRVIVLELALQQARARLAELESRASDGGAAGGFAGSPGATAPASVPQVGGGSGVSSFLKTAAAAAAGAVGGELIYDGLRHWAAGHGGAGGGLFGASNGSGFLPADRDGTGAYTDTSERDDDDGFRSYPIGTDAVSTDTDESTDGGDGGGGDWGDDGTSGDDSTGGGGDW